MHALATSLVPGEREPGPREWWLGAGDADRHGVARVRRHLAPPAPPLYPLRGALRGGLGCTAFPRYSPSAMPTPRLGGSAFE